jgi:hypothetical protein
VKANAKDDEEERKLDHLEDSDFLELFPNGIQLDPTIYSLLKTALIEDVLALEEMGSTDYSLIIGIRPLDLHYEQARATPLQVSNKLILCVI